MTLFNGDKRQSIISLVDSGADACLFHSSIADRLGIDVRSVKPTEFDGIAEGISVQVYFHPVHLQIQGFTEKVEISAGFTDSNSVYGLLGQAGFFENYQVIFERYKGRFEIASRPST